MSKLTKIIVVFVLVFSFGVVQAEGSTVQFIIRSGGNLLWQGEVELPTPGTTSVNDSNGVSHDINSQSILAALIKADELHSEFEISNLTYYDSFGSFYLKCITGGSGESCDNWQYAVDESNPFSSIDQYILSGGETVGIYFGDNHRIYLAKNTVNTGESFSATAQKYKYSNNSWIPLAGVSIGVTLPNPDDAWNPIVVNTYSVDTNGSASLTLNEPNTYNLGIVEDYYFPLYPVTVNPVAQSGGSYGSSVSNIGGVVLGAETKKSSNILNKKALVEFLKKNQKEDGSFGPDLYTDWAAIALSSTKDSAESLNKVAEYLAKNNKAFSLPQDNARRAMALLALGFDPQTTSGINNIKPIIDSFDGHQFGDTELINDDIFALLVLSKTGYSVDDDIIKKDVSFVLSKQGSDGSFENSIDLTAAAVLALKNYVPLPYVAVNIDRATQYIKLNQSEDGGWGNAYSTSWVLGVVNFEKEKWTKNNKSGFAFLGTLQDTDGGLLEPEEKLENRIWATSYAVPVAYGMEWNSLLKKFNRSQLVFEPKTALYVSDDLKNNFKVTYPKTYKKLVSAIEKQEIEAPAPEQKTGKTFKQRIKNIINWLFD